MARNAARPNEVKLYVDNDTYEALTLIKEFSGFASMSEAAASELKARVLGSTWMIRKMLERSGPLLAVTGPVNSTHNKGNPHAM